MPIAPTSYATLSAMITPAIFMTANGSLIISTSNRMSRVVDRIRVLNDKGDDLCRGGSGLDFVEDRRAHIADQLERLAWRGDRIRYALTMLYLAFASFVGTSLTLAIDTLIGNRLEAVPASTWSARPTRPSRATGWRSPSSATSRPAAWPWAGVRRGDRPRTHFARSLSISPGP